MTDIEKHGSKMYEANRKVQMAFALMQRAKLAGIPDAHMKIGPKDFQSIVCRNFHKEKTEKLVEKIYGDPTFIKKYDAVAIDGGNFMSRRKAIFAILYRVITFDNFGRYEDFGDATEIFKRFQAEESKNLIDSMKNTDILGLSEFSKTMFQKAPYSIPKTWDAILERRYDDKKVTMISFTHPLPSNQLHALDDDICGLFMPLIYNHDVDKQIKILRIRVTK
jgi:hypothetical protein